MKCCSFFMRFFVFYVKVVSILTEFRKTLEKNKGHPVLTYTFIKVQNALIKL